MALSSSSFAFGRLRLDACQVFFESALSYACVNLRPLVRGHVLVLPKRRAERVRELSGAELADLWQSVQCVAARLERWSGAAAFTFAIQDGAAAGQSVPHVHVHIVPRVVGDFARNDDVYTALDAASGSATPLRVEPDERRRARSMEEMSSEADELRALFASL